MARFKLKDLIGKIFDKKKEKEKPRKEERLVKLYDMGAIPVGQGFRTSDGETYVHAKHKNTKAETGFFMKLKPSGWDGMTKKAKSKLKRQWKQAALQMKGKA